MRWFRSGVKEEERVAISPLGDLIGFRSVLQGGRARARGCPGGGPRPRAALSGLAGPSRVGLEPIEATPVARPTRTDWKFVDEKTGVQFADATIRYATTVSGDRVTAFREFVHVPEAWTRDYERLRSKNEAAGQSRPSASSSTLLAMLARPRRARSRARTCRGGSSRPSAASRSCCRSLDRSTTSR